MSDLVFWSGPVAKFQIPGATLPGAAELFVGCCGDTTPPCPSDSLKTCPSIGQSIAGSTSSLLQLAHLDRVGSIYMAGFSAGGSIMKRLLENSEYRAITAAVHAADATYTGAWVDESRRLAPPIEGYVLWAVDVINGTGDKLFVATASPRPNKTWATGIENLQAIRREVERRTGQIFVERGDFFGVNPGPDHVYQLGNVLLAEYPEVPLGHGHFTIAPQIWQKIIQPWVAKGKGPLDFPGGVEPPGPGPGPGSVVPGEEPPSIGWGFRELVLFLGFSAASYYGIARWLKRR